MKSRVARPLAARRLLSLAFCAVAAGAALAPACVFGGICDPVIGWCLLEPSPIPAELPGATVEVPANQTVEFYSLYLSNLGCALLE